MITGENAVKGVQSLQINKLAKTGYLTGAQIKAADGGSLTAASKLSELGVTGEGTFNITAGGKSVDITVNGDSTISDVLNKIKEAGVNASLMRRTRDSSSVPPHPGETMTSVLPHRTAPVTQRCQHWD